MPKLFGSRLKLLKRQPLKLQVNRGDDSRKNQTKQQSDVVLRSIKMYIHCFDSLFWVCVYLTASATTPVFSTKMTICLPPLAVAPNPTDSTSRFVRAFEKDRDHPISTGVSFVARQSSFFRLFCLVADRILKQVCYDGQTAKSFNGSFT